MLTFDPVEPTGDDQKIVNIFYYNCYMHDYFYLLGFREKDGNFQRDNLGRGGIPADRVDARSFPVPIEGTATMLTLPDGTTPLMSMGLVSSTGRHTAFDSTVVFHEFTHGVTTRLVGGPLNTSALEAHQSKGMGEGWGDYIACTINDTTVVGAWVTNRAGGIRGFPYDSDFPDNFGRLGTGRFTGFLPDGRRHPHPIGEIWCATLMEMNRNIGAGLAVQLVVDALKLAPPNPSFLEMRDSILAALDAMLTAGELGSDDHSAAQDGIWAAFAKFGMGPDAHSNGASLSGIIADFNKP
jgi:extracellular elastinolytic metalloproteinase